MKNLKKVLALVVVFAMMMSTVAFAGYPDVDATADYADSVALLSALEILEGDEQGKFNPESTITRAEFAAVVCRALGLENNANSAAGATIFNDVAANHWATGYINLATQQGIVNGKGNGIFDPEGNVTYAEAVKMLVVALGFEPVAAAKGGYPTGYLAVANSIKMTAGIYGTGTNVPALRKTVAMLTANAMEIPVMDQTYGTEVYWTQQDGYDNYRSLLSDMDIYVATGVVGAVDKEDATFGFKFTTVSDDFEFGFAVVGNTVQWKHNVSDYKNGLVTDVAEGIKFNVADSNVADMFQTHSKVYVEKVGRDEYNAVIAISSEIGDSVVINSSDLDTAKAVLGETKEKTVEYFESAESIKASKIEVAANPTIIVNGVPFAETVDFDLAQFYNNDASIEFIENTNDKYYDTVLVTVYQNAIVDTVDADEAAYSAIETAKGDTITFDLTNSYKDIEFKDAEGNDIALTDIAEGDVLSIVVRDTNIYTSGSDSVSISAPKNYKDKITVINLGKNVVEGTIEGSDDNYAYINGTEYELAAVFADKNRAEVYDNGAIINGAEGIFYLSSTGKIIGFEGTAPVNYGYITNIYKNDNNANKVAWEVSMLTADSAEAVEFDVYKTVEVDGTSYKKTNIDDSTANNYEGCDELYAALSTGVVEYKLTTDGDIKYIKKLTGSAITNDAEFNANSGRIDGNKLNEDVVIFDISDGLSEAKTVDYSALIDDGKYRGSVYAKKGTAYNVFVMTKGDADFNAEANTLIAVSTMDTTFNGEEAYAVTYYEDGNKTAKTAYFTEDSKAKYTSIAYDKITKGSVFYANVNAEGVVSTFEILATMDVATAKLTVYDAVLEALVLDADSDVAFIYGDITGESDDVYTVNKVEFAGTKYTDKIEILGGENEYQFNAEANDSRKYYVDIRSFDANGVGAPDAEGKYFVFAKFVDKELVDIYSSTQGQ